MEIKQLPTKTKHNTIYENLCGKIARGEFSPGQQIPTEMELSKKFKTARPTVNKALKMLEKNGLIYRVQGSGTYVSENDRINETKCYSILMPWLFGQKIYDHGIFDTIVSNITHQGFLGGYSLVMPGAVQQITPDNFSEHCSTLVKELVAKGVSGVIYMSPEKGILSEDAPEQLAETFFNEGIAVVLLDHDLYDYPKRSKFDLVGVCNEHGAYTATEHLINNGCKKIDFITTPSVSPTIKARKRGYLDALRQNGLTADPKRIKEITIEKSIDILNIIKENDTKALVCVNDKLAAFIMRNVLDSGYKVPEDIKMVGFDDNPIAEHLPVPLTTVKQPIEAISRESIKMLVDRIENPKLPAKDVLFTTELIIRKSCGTK